MNAREVYVVQSLSSRWQQIAWKRKTRDVCAPDTTARSKRVLNGHYEWELMLSKCHESSFLFGISQRPKGATCTTSYHTHPLLPLNVGSSDLCKQHGYTEDSRRTTLSHFLALPTLRWIRPGELKCIRRVCYLYDSPHAVVGPSSSLFIHFYLLLPNYFWIYPTCVNPCFSENQSVRCGRMESI